MEINIKEYKVAEWVAIIGSYGIIILLTI